MYLEFRSGMTVSSNLLNFNPRQFLTFFPIYVRTFFPTCFDRKRITIRNCMHVNNKKPAKYSSLNSHYLTFTCAKSVLIYYDNFTLIYATHF